MIRRVFDKPAYKTKHFLYCKVFPNYKKTFKRTNVRGKM